MYSKKRRDVTAGRCVSTRSANRAGGTGRKSYQDCQDPFTVFFFLKTMRDYPKREASPLQLSEILLLMREQQSQSLTQGRACADSGLSRHYPDGDVGWQSPAVGG